jgi:hypothetical protein
MGEYKLRKRYIYVSRLSLFLIWNNIIRKGQRVYVFSIFAHHNGLFIHSLRYLIGPDAAALWIIRFYKLFGVNLSKIRSPGIIPNYHKKQIQALSSFTNVLTDYGASEFMLSDKNIIPKGIEADIRKQWLLQRLNEELWKLYVDLYIFSHEYPGEKVFLLDKKSMGYGLKKIIEESLGIKFNEAKLSSRLFEGIIVASYSIILMFKSVFRAFGLGVSQVPRGFIAVEFVDPTITSGDATHPKFLVSEYIDKSDIIQYCSADQSFAFDKNSNHRDDTLFLDQLTLNFKEATAIIYYAIIVTFSALSSSRAIRHYFKEIAVYRHHILLGSMFRRSSIRAHLFNTFPNGRTNNKNVSASVTSVCHKYNVRSYSYQTRFQYINDCWYYFETFDTYFIWGDAWVESLKMTNYIDRYVVVGSPYLLSYKPVDYQEPSINSYLVCMILADIEEDFPTHYTSDYTKTVLTIVLDGIRDFIALGNTVVLTIRLKHANTISIVEEFIQDKYFSGLTIAIDDASGETYQNLIGRSDYVFAIGFTSPGMEGILLNKKAAYITEYKDIYSGVVSEISEQCVLHDCEEVYQFLVSGSKTNIALLDRLDPYRDTHMGIRIGKIIKNEISRNY